MSDPAFVAATHRHLADSLEEIDRLRAALEQKTQRLRAPLEKPREDPASFVAATHRHLADSLEENERLRAALEQKTQSLRAELEKKSEITVTGRGGAPIYARGSMGGDDERNVDGSLPVDLDNTDAGQSLRVSQLKSVEIRLGGTLIYFLGGKDVDEDCMDPVHYSKTVWVFHFSRSGTEAAAPHTATLYIDFGLSPVRLRLNPEGNDDTPLTGEYRDEEITYIRFWRFAFLEDSVDDDPWLSRPWSESP